MRIHIEDFLLEFLKFTLEEQIRHMNISSKIKLLKKCLIIF